MGERVIVKYPVFFRASISSPSRWIKQSCGNDRFCPFYARRSSVRLKEDYYRQAVQRGSTARAVLLQLFHCQLSVCYTDSRSFEVTLSKGAMCDETCTHWRSHH